MDLSPWGAPAVVERLAGHRNEVWRRDSTLPTAAVDAWEAANAWLVEPAYARQRLARLACG